LGDESGLLHVFTSSGNDEWVAVANVLLTTFSSELIHKIMTNKKIKQLSQESAL
jgi:hypothetical protein